MGKSETSLPLSCYDPGNRKLGASIENLSDLLFDRQGKGGFYLVPKESNQFGFRVGIPEKPEQYTQFVKDLHINGFSRFIDSDHTWDYDIAQREKMSDKNMWKNFDWNKIFEYEAQGKKFTLKDVYIGPLDNQNTVKEAGYFLQEILPKVRDYHRVTELSDDGSGLKIEFPKVFQNELAKKAEVYEALTDHFMWAMDPSGQTRSLS